jgi:hypothetical protein
MLERPNDVPSSPPSREDGLRGQQKIYAIASARRGSGARVALTEEELNGFITRHVVEIGDLPLSDVSARLIGANVANVFGRVPIASLVNEASAQPIARALPPSWLEHRVWIRLVTNVRVEPGPGGHRYLRLDVIGFSIGRQPLPALLSRLLLDPTALQWLRWTLPGAVEDVRIEKGQAVVRMAA